MRMSLSYAAAQRGRTARGQLAEVQELVRPDQSRTRRPLPSGSSADRHQPNEVWLCIGSSAFSCPQAFLAVLLPSPLLQLHKPLSQSRNLSCKLFLAATIMTIYAATSKVTNKVS